MDQCDYNSERQFVEVSFLCSSCCYDMAFPFIVLFFISFHFTPFLFARLSSLLSGVFTPPVPSFFLLVFLLFYHLFDEPLLYFNFFCFLLSNVSYVSPFFICLFIHILYPWWMDVWMDVAKIYSI